MPLTYNIKKRTKYIFITMFLSLFVFKVYPQMDAQLSQYMYNHASFNPASIGENGMINASGVQKLQWLGIFGAPRTTYFTLNSPLKIGKTNQAVGVTFLRDQAGAFTNQSANVQYAYKKKVADGILSIGASVGFMGLGIESDSLKDIHGNSFQSEYHEKTDNAVPKSDVYGLGLDVNAGVFFTGKKYYAGISYVHLNNSSFVIGDTLEYKMRGIGYFTAGYEIALENPKILIKPSALIKSDFTTWQIDLSSRIEYDKRFWGGLSYRFQDAVVIFAGINISNGMSIGYAYDLPASTIIRATSGSHELQISYSFSLDMSKKNNKYKSIRIL